MKNRNLFTFIFLLVILHLFVLPVRAISPSPIPVITEAPSGVEEKIQQIREEVKKKVREKIEQTKKGAKMAYFGEISKITDSSLTLDTFMGEKNVKVASDAAIIGKNGKSVKFSDLEIGSFAITMGYFSEENILEARRIITVTKPKVNVREVVFGKVTDVSLDEKILTVKNEKKGLIYTVVATDKTIITKKMDGKIQKVKFTDIEKGDRLVAIGTSTENEEKVITAKLIHVIPGLTKEKPTTTPQPSPSATPSE